MRYIMNNPEFIDNYQSNLRTSRYIMGTIACKKLDSKGKKCSM
jgi:hypothetical protein